MKVAIIGSSGAIGHAFADIFLQDESVEKLYLFSRSLDDSLNICQPESKANFYYIDIEDEESIKEAALKIVEGERLDIVIVSTGVLSVDGIRPEKGINELSSDNLMNIYRINTIGPALVAKYFVPKLNDQKKSIFAALSARVGSISDNFLGGWYSYRCSKVALNMILKNISIEFKNKNPKLIVVGLHPGTVDSKLSKPFAGNIKNRKIFTPGYSAEQMMLVLSKLTSEDSGKVFAWDGEEVEY